MKSIISYLTQPSCSRIEIVICSVGTSSAIAGQYMLTLCIFVVGVIINEVALAWSKS